MSITKAELLRNAVAFLADPKTQESPLTQRIQFLEGKGLNREEIDLAVREAALLLASRSGPAEQYAARSATAYPPSIFGINAHHSRSDWDWRDYLLTALFSGGLMYGAVAVARKYLLPHLRPPSQTQYEADNRALVDQFDGIELRLQELKLECEATRIAAESQKNRIQSLVDEVDNTLKAVKDVEQKNRDELREMREEVEVIRNTLPQMLEKNKEGTTMALSDLQQELKSLRTLLLNASGRIVANGTSSPALPPLTGKPSIPSWQLSMGPDSSQTVNDSGVVEGT